MQVAIDLWILLLLHAILFTRPASWNKFMHQLNADDAHFQSVHIAHQHDAAMAVQAMTGISGTKGPV